MTRVDRLRGILDAVKEEQRRLGQDWPWKTTVPAAQLSQHIYAQKAQGRLGVIVEELERAIADVRQMGEAGERHGHADCRSSAARPSRSSSSRTSFLVILP